MRGQHPGLESGLGTADGSACRGIPPDLELCNPHFLPNPSTESRITFFTSPDHASIPSKQLIPLILQIHPTHLSSPAPSPRHPYIKPLSQPLRPTHLHNAINAPLSDPSMVPTFSARGMGCFPAPRAAHRRPASRPPTPARRFCHGRKPSVCQKPRNRDDRGAQLWVRSLGTSSFNSFRYTCTVVPPPSQSLHLACTIQS